MKNTEIENYIVNTVLNEKKVPSFGIEIRRDGKTLFSGYYGHSDDERKTPLCKENIYYMYSMTKPLTIAATMQLTEEGAIKTSDPVKKFLPEYGDIFLMRDGKKVKPARDMTVYDLLTMTSGLSYARNTPSIRALLGDSGKTTRDYVAAFIKEPLLCSPGEAFNYSLSHDVLGAVIEVVTGKKFSTVMHDKLFAPLGMKSSCFNATDTARTKLAAQYILQNGEYVLCENVNRINFSNEYESGGGGLISNASDYAIFADTLARGGISADGVRILKEETVKEMTTLRVASASVDGSFTCVQGDDYGYGYGVRVRTRKSEYTPTGEFGWDGAAGSYFFVDPTAKLSMVFTIHVNGWPNGLLNLGADLRELTCKHYSNR